MIPRLSHALLRARETMMERYRSALTGHGLTEPQWRVLRALSEAGTLDATRLSERSGVAPPSLSRMLQTLEARGLITVSRDPGDARRARLALTAAGDETVDTVAPDIARSEAAILDAFGTERTRALALALEDMAQALDG